MKHQKFFSTALSLFAILLLVSGCAEVATTPYPKKTTKKTEPTQKPYTINGKKYYPVDSADGYRERGIASWYGKKFHDRKTSNGETYNMYAPTAAHKTLPMDTMLLVRNLENGRETVVRINDRGPFVRGRIIDLSYKAASEINMLNSGVAKTEIIALGEYASGRAGKKGKRKLKHKDFKRGDFYIQIGSFLNKNNAERLARKFHRSGAGVVIRPYKTSGYTYYRVQISAGRTLAMAKSLEKKFLGMGYTGAFIFAR